jgi:putative oxidoreductase
VISPEKSLQAWPLVRVSVSAMFVFHGANTLLGLFSGSQGSTTPVPFGTWPGWYAGALQFICGIMVLVGFSTRFFAVIASGVMAYAYFTVHQPKALLPLQNGGDAAALFSWSFLAIAIVGAGKWSIDELRTRRPARGATERRVVTAQRPA